MSSKGRSISKRDFGSDDKPVSRIISVIGNIRHYSFKIHIQDGKVIQIDKLDKLRIR